MYARLPWGELAVAGAFFLLACTAISVARAAGTVALVWPGNALAAALFVRMPRIRWVSAFGSVGIAGVVANMLSAHDTLFWAAAMTAINLLEIGTTTWVLRSRLRFPLPNISSAQAIQMVGIFAFAIPALSCIPGGWLVHAMFGVAQASATADWWRSDAIGSCLCAPAIYLFSRKSARRLVSRRFALPNLALSLICLAATCLAIRFVRFPLVVLEVPLIVAAFRTGSLGGAVLSGLCGMVVIGLWSLGIHPEGLEYIPGAATIQGLPFLALIATLLPPVAVGLATDQRRNATRALRFSERQFRQSVAHSPIGIVIASLDGTWKVANAAMHTMLGFSEAELQAIGWQRLTHPDDHADIRAKRQMLLSGAIDKYEAERRYLGKGGDWIWVRVAVSMVRDDDGRPLHFIRQVENLDDRRRAENELADERQRLRTTLRAIADAVVTTDADGCITYINAAAEELLGQSLDAIEGRRFYDVVAMTDPRTAKRSQMALGKCLARGEIVRRPDAVLLHRPDGGVRYVSKAASPLFGEDGRVTGAVVVLRDATADYERDRKLSHLASHDILTGLCNRFEFERRLQALFERAKVLILPATLLVVDLDRFKAVNDGGGHAAGDAVLRRVAEVLTSAVRNTDTVARVGGDEFAIVLEKATPERARAVAQQILRALNPLQFEWDGIAFSVGASVGVATIAAEYHNIAAWMAAADGACYEAKRAQRGQIRFAQGD